MLSRLWRSIRYGIAAKFYLLTAIALAALVVLAAASTHFASQTRTAAERLYGEGVVGIQTVTELEVLFEQHRALITAAPALLDRSRIRASRLAVAALNARIEESVQTQLSRSDATREILLQQIAAHVPTLSQAGDRVLMLAHNFAQEKALAVSEGEYAQAANVIQGAMEGRYQEQIRQVDREVHRLSEASSGLMLWVVASALVAFVLIGPVTLWAKHRILSRLGKITAVMHRLCNNELGVDVPFTKALDEMGDIARTIDVFKGNAIALGLTHLQLDAALNNMVQGLCMLDAQHRLVLCNDRFLEIFRLSRQDVTPGIGLSGLIQSIASANGFPEGSAVQFHKAYIGRAFVDGSDSYQQEYPDGRVIAVSRRELPGGGWVDTHEDITERRRAEKQIAYLAEYDTLTDLPNRNLFQRKLTEALEVAATDQLAIFGLDLDGFKTVNDMFGHSIGDELLRQVARRLQHCVGEQGMVARLGGDEFAILQGGQPQPHGAAALALAVTEALNAPYDLAGNQAVLGASIGIAIFPGDASLSEDLLKCADMALYSAKADGRGICRFFEPEMNARAKARRQLEVDLRAAIAGKQFEMFYQPVVSVDSNEVIAFEALIRWRHPDRGMVSPAEFIPVAEETGLIIPLGEWILRQVCTDALSWPRAIRVAVNLSPVQFRSPNLVQTVFTALAVSHLEPGRLELEITETTLLQDSEAILERLHQLKSYGVQISMDDFGTGYSSLSYLRSFPFDKIKIDQSFVRGLGKLQDSLAIIRAVISLGKNLGMTTNAEGVETADQLRILKEELCDEVQGFLFSPAVPLKETHRLLGLSRSSAVIVA
ncbi:EAL domain-containing protein [Bradyrhizobium sediminis]|uniref:EAL domain-containing protein n=1 Tax=Bradyrhizobium sediminis TaxID=2840469 RepID=A0A975P077_9BRAD|nr:EAL domain-containing protein [Bradyrhizobium sediminis]QWG24532.1 EAL domain-containing protein [Bradyrhizobium sediminis]